MDYCQRRARAWPLLSNSVTFARNKNMPAVFSSWNKNSSKWVKYEKVTVFSSPLLLLNGSPWPKWGWMWAEEDSLVWAAASRQAQGKQGQRRREELRLKPGLAVTRFKYPSVGDLQNTVVGAVFRVWTGRRSRGLALVKRFTSKPQCWWPVSSPDQLSVVCIFSLYLLAQIKLCLVIVDVQIKKYYLI